MSFPNDFFSGPFMSDFLGTSSTGSANSQPEDDDLMGRSLSQDINLFLINDMMMPQDPEAMLDELVIALDEISPPTTQSSDIAYLMSAVGVPSSSQSFLANDLTSFNKTGAISLDSQTGEDPALCPEVILPDDGNLDDTTGTVSSQETTKISKKKKKANKKKKTSSNNKTLKKFLTTPNDKANTAHLFTPVGRGTFLKPPFTFTSLIALALDSTEDNQMCVPDMYIFISGYFPYYKTAGNGWKNSLRHNLSLTRSFVKTEFHRTAQKGYNWTYNPKCKAWLDHDVSRRAVEEERLKHCLASKDVLDHLRRFGLVI